MKGYAKAIVGAATAFFTSLMTALISPGVTGVEWCVIALAVLGTFGTVYAIPNTPNQ